MLTNLRPLALLALATGFLASCNDREARVLPPHPKVIGQANRPLIDQPEQKLRPRLGPGLEVDKGILKRIGLRLTATSVIAPGVIWRAFSGRTTGGKAMYANSVDFDLADPRYEARVAVARGPGSSRRESTRRMAARLGAVAGINGSYFNFGGGPLDGVPIGLVVSDGRLIKSGDGNRPALAIDGDGSAIIGRPPADDARIKDALEGGPVLLSAGKPAKVIGSGFGWSIESGREPRTAVGLTPDGRMVWVTVDGRVPGHSLGMTLGELTGLFQALGASDALNWDGGGSTTLVVKGRLVSRIATGWCRPVSNALVLMPRGGKIKRS